MNFSSKLLENTISEFAKLPGIGQKTALRMVLWLLNQSEKDVEKFSQSISQLKEKIRFCQICQNISDQVLCEICADPRRDQSTICVVENIRDVMAIENTDQFHGTYHVLGGLISPIDGVSPSDLTIYALIERVQSNPIVEVILAVSATMEGDTTIFYIHKKLKDFPIKISTIARGISFGGELEYVDEMTLGRSIITRIPYENA